MFFPLGTDRPLARPTLVNHLLIGLNIAIAMLMFTLQQTQPDLWKRVMTWAILDPHAVKPWAFVTYSFLHGGLWHLLGNMLFLWCFGPNTEDRLGRVGYVAFYLIGAAAAGGAHVLASRYPVIGASGAIAAVTGAYLVLFPHTQIRCFVLWLTPGVFMIPAWWFIVARVAWDLLLEAGRAGDNVARVAHLGGYGFGGAVAMALLGLRVLKREPYDLFSMAKQAARRRQFRELEYARARQGSAAHKAAASARPDPQSDAVAAARAEVTGGIARQDLCAAAVAYRRLLDHHKHIPGATLLNRRHQYDLANYFFASGDHQTAAVAYELFSEGYPNDPELPVVGLMLGLINARYLNDPVRAKREIAGAMPGLPEGEHKKLARDLLAELG